MEIDNSAANEFRACPLMYFEGRLAQGTGLEPKSQVNEVTSLDIGTRVHQLFECHYKDMAGYDGGAYAVPENELLEIEAQMIFEAYKAKYPVEDFDIVDVERSFRVQLPIYCKACYQKIDKLRENYNGDSYCECGETFPFAPHIYTGKIDLTFRNRENGMLNILDHKTEKRQSRSNSPQKWAARDQASLYLWAATAIYKEPIERFIVNIIKRPSPKFNEPPTFPDRQKLERTKEQIETAVRDIVFIADDIERYKRVFGYKVWPSNREICDSYYGQCDFYLPHVFGWSQDILEQKYQKKTEYLNLGGIPIIQP